MSRAASMLLGACPVDRRGDRLGCRQRERLGADNRKTQTPLRLKGSSAAPSPQSTGFSKLDGPLLPRRGKNRHS